MDTHKLAETKDECMCDLCKKYRPLYDFIKKGRCRWITISPRYSDREPECDYKDFREDFLEQLIKAGTVLGVAEMTENLRLHYHLLLDEQDKIKSYKLINGQRKTNQVAYLKGVPEKGLHYLFKDIKWTEEYVECAIYTSDTIKTARQDRIKKAKIIRDYERQQERRVEYKDIPKAWLKTSDSDTDSE